MLGGLEAAVRALRGRSVPHALIGAAAMAGRGVMRATDDLDLLVTDRSVLREDAWRAIADQGFTVTVREPDRALDVVVGRHSWQAEVIQRAEPHRIGGVEVGLVLASDLILLKLYAGARQDLLDVEAILAAGDRQALVIAVEALIGRLPTAAREAWRAVAR